MREAKLGIVALCLTAYPVSAFMPRPNKCTFAGGASCPSTSSSTTTSSPSSFCCSKVNPSSSSRCADGSRLGATSVIDSPSDVEPPINGISDVELIDTGAAPALAATSSQGNALKDELIELVGGDFLTTSAHKRALVNELLIKLEALNPTSSPAYSPLLNGAWEFVWSGGISPGILGLQLASRISNVASGAVEVGETILTISRSQPRVEVQTNLKVFGRDNSIKIRTRLEPASDLRLDETYVEASAGQLKVPFPDSELLQRPLFVSYLDEDLLVVRDTFGCPDVLYRKDKDFKHPYSGVPSATDDDLSPGAG